MRGGRTGGLEELKWADSTLPADDSIANSMYGGTQQMFQQPVNYQQPVQTPVYQQPTPVPVQPVAPIIPAAGPQVPATGLPSGWTMEQWNYYGQQYLDALNHQ